MENSFLEQNPFYVLQVTASTNRRSLRNKVDELSFSLSPEKCNEAQNVLLQPSKRIGAEMDWFPTANEHQTAVVRNCISQSKKIESISTDPVGTLNILLHNYQFIPMNDLFSTGYGILDIDKAFSALSAESILSLINETRRAAGVAESTSSDIIQALIAKRSSIRSIIRKKIDTLDDNNRIELATILAERCIANSSFEDGVIIEDVISEYEIWSQEPIEKLGKMVQVSLDLIQKYTPSTPHSTVMGMVESLIHDLKDWDRYVQPLQVLDLERGITHTTSVQMASNVRGVSVFLHNSLNKTDLAIMLSEALSEVFAELPDVVDKMAEDLKVLRNIRAQQMRAATSNTTTTSSAPNSSRASTSSSIRSSPKANTSISSSTTTNTQAKRIGNKSWIWIALGLIAVIVVVIWMGWPSIVSTTIPAPPKYTTTITPSKPANQPQELPLNGKILSGTSGDAGGSICVKASSDSSCYVKLKTADGTTKLSFFVRAGQTATVGVPSGHYYVYFAEGTDWYGTSDVFGDSTRYSKDDELLDFNGYEWTYTLYSVTNGNFTTTKVDPSEF